MAMGNPFRRKDGTINPIAVCIAIVLVLLAVFGGSLAISLNRANGLINSARDAYAKAQTSLEGGSFEEAYASARSAVNDISALNHELEGPQWRIAAVLPVIGTDVKAAQEMGAIAGKLADEVATPLFDQWDSLTQGDAQRSDGQPDTPLLDKLAKFTETLANARQIVYECEERANQLPTTHIGQLNEAATSLKGALTSVGDMLRTFDNVVGSLDPTALIGQALIGGGIAPLFQAK